MLIHDLNFVTRAICVNFLNVLLFDMLSTILFGEVGSFFSVQTVENVCVKLFVRHCALSFQCVIADFSPAIFLMR